MPREDDALSTGSEQVQRMSWHVYESATCASEMVEGILSCCLCAGLLALSNLLRTQPHFAAPGGVTRLVVVVVRQGRQMHREGLAVMRGNAANVAKRCEHSSSCVWRDNGKVDDVVLIDMMQTLLRPCQPLEPRRSLSLRERFGSTETVVECVLERLL